MDLFIHGYLAAFAIIFIYILLHRAMRKKMVAGKVLQGQTGTKDNGNHFQVQRNFVRVNFMLLAILVTCNLPLTVVWTVRLLVADSLNAMIGFMMSAILFYLRFLLNPIV